MKSQALLIFTVIFTLSIQLCGQREPLISPNPFEKQVSIQIKAEFGDSLRGNWYNLSGTPEFSLDPMMILHDTVISVEKDLSSGVYLLSLTQGKDEKLWKVLRAKDGQSAEIIFDIDIDESSQPEELVVFPNPSLNGLFSLRYGDHSPELSVSIFDPSGKLIHHEKIKKQYGTHREIDLRGQAAGVYYLELNSAGKQHSQILIIE